MIAVRTNETLTMYDISLKEFKKALFQSDGLNSEKIRRAKRGLTISNNDTIESLLDDEVVESIECCVEIDDENISYREKPTSREDLKFYISKDGKQYASEEAYKNSVSSQKKSEVSVSQSVVRAPEAPSGSVISKPQQPPTAQKQPKPQQPPAAQKKPNPQQPPAYAVNIPDKQLQMARVINMAFKSKNYRRSLGLWSWHSIRKRYR